MPDGPPWIESVTKDTLPDGWLGYDQDAVGTATVFHLRLDENRRWTIQADFIRPGGNVNELNASFNKPVHFNTPERFLFINDAYPQHKGPFRNFKFDNEDIYVGAQYKLRYDASLTSVWSPCRADGAALDLPNNAKCIMDFSNGAGSKIRVTVTLEP
jgi:hypothetical protein